MDIASLADIIPQKETRVPAHELANLLTEQQLKYLF
jgi:hypothetical protein